VIASPKVEKELGEFDRKNSQLQHGFESSIFLHF